MNPESALKIINHASQQDATWHLVALVVIGILFVIAIFRWFTKRMEKLESKMDMQSTEFIQHLKIANKEMLEVIHQNQTTTNRAIAIMDRLEIKLDYHKNTP